MSRYVRLPVPAAAAGVACGMGRGRLAAQGLRNGGFEDVPGAAVNGARLDGR